MKNLLLILVLLVGIAVFLFIRNQNGLNKEEELVPPPPDLIQIQESSKEESFRRNPNAPVM